MIVDACLDHVPENIYDNERLLNGFLNCIGEETGYKAYVGQTGVGLRQLILVKPEGCQNLNYVDGEYSLQVKLQAMDECGVAMIQSLDITDAEKELVLGGNAARIFGLERSH